METSTEVSETGGAGEEGEAGSTKVTTTKNSALGVTLTREDTDFLPDDDDDGGESDGNGEGNGGDISTPADENFSSPLVLDLDKDGILSTPLFGSNVYFDSDGDGFRERTAWIDPGDGLLAIDLDGDGKIKSAKELFGNYTPLGSGAPATDAFEALLELDENGDGLIDAKDSAFADLRVWVDDGKFKNRAKQKRKENIFAAVA
jgi:hypothetical protein